MKNLKSKISFGENYHKIDFSFNLRTHLFTKCFRLLRAVSLDKDINKRRDVIKKVIAYMTLGIDVSRLYPEMVKASRTDDVVMKKMIYLYLINYAE